MAGIAAGGGRRSKLAPYLLVAPGVLWLVFFYVVPIGTLARTSVGAGDVSVWTSYSNALEAYGQHFLRSFGYAALSTLIAILMGYPLAYVLAFRAGRFKNFLLGLVILPFFTTFLVRTLSWKSILGDNGFVVAAFRFLHLLPPDGRLLNTLAAVVGGLTYNFLPFMILPIYVSLEKIDPRLVEAAGDLYSGPKRAFLKVVLPLSMPGVFAGSLLTFIPASGDFINAELLGSPNQQMIGTVIQNQFLEVRDFSLASAVSFILMVVIILGVFAYARALGTEELGVKVSAAGEVGARWPGRLLDAVAALVLLYLFVPIFVIVLYSFNRPEGRFNFVWKAFSVDAWQDPFKYPQLVDAMKLSLKVAAISTGVSVLFGTLIALAICRYSFRGSGGIGLLLVLPLTTAEVVLGSALLSLFLQMNTKSGFATIVIAHIMFQVSYVALTVKARIRGFDWTLEEAAMDLGASPFRVVMRVTLPLIAPGIAAAAMLSFALSLDDFIITMFNAGSRVTYPLYVYGAQRAAYPPQINVIATCILVASLLLLGASVLWQRRVEAKSAPR